ncbi:MAG TPA: AMP-binding protein [Rhodocyclaceae bacterium]|nr:AMP-binding protein [Rhodocyclaceae bacterium]
MSPSPEALFEALAIHRQRVILKEGDRYLIGAQVLEEVAARVERLRRHACRRVAIALENGLDWALWDLAILKAGLVCVPLPGFFSAAQQQHVLDGAGVDSLVAADPKLRVAAGFHTVDGQLAIRTPGTAVTLPVGTAKITFTSGTTGQPKGVCLDARAQLEVAYSLRVATEACAPSRHLCVLPLSVLLENVAGLYAPLLAGAQVELVPTDELGLAGSSRVDAHRFINALMQHQPHSVILLPQLLLMLVSAIEGTFPRPQSLRFIAVGGGRVAPQLLQRAEAVGLPVFEGYGLSECASVVCLNTPEERRIGTVGRPLPHVGLRLADDGEVLVRGAPMLGYVGEPERQGEWLPTGDLGHFDQGFLILHGRKKHQFVTAFGRNVSPEWVEAELVQQAPIAQAWLQGEAMPQNVAVLVPRTTDTSDAALDAAVMAVNQGLPDYARVHRWIRADAPFSASNGFATTNGRLRRTALDDHYRRAIERLLATEPTHGEC